MEDNIETHVGAERPIGIDIESDVKTYVVRRVEPISDYIALMEPFRQATPTPPLPWPRHQGRPSPEVAQVFRDYEIRVADKLHELGLTYTSMSLVRQWRVPQKRLNTISILTFDEDHQSWLGILQTVHHSLPTEAATLFQLEIENPQKARRTVTSSSSVGEADMSFYESLTPKLGEYITKYPGDVFFGFYCCQRIHRRLEDPKPTILIHVHEDAEADWAKVAADIQKMVGDGKLLVELRPVIFNLGVAGGDDEDEDFAQNRVPLGMPKGRLRGRLGRCIIL